MKYKLFNPCSNGIQKYFTEVVANKTYEES